MGRSRRGRPWSRRSRPGLGSISYSAPVQPRVSALESGEQRAAVSTTKRSAWELTVGGLQLPITDQGMVLGRDPTCDLPLEDARVSWRHVRIALVDGFPVITDLGSSNGTYLDGRRMDAEPSQLKRDAIVQIGGVRLRVRESISPASTTTARFRRVPVRGRSIRIGRAPDNDVVLDEPNISWHHAELRPGSPPTLVDLGSRNGVRLGNELLQNAGALYPGTPAGIGPFGLRYENGELIVVDER